MCERNMFTPTATKVRATSSAVLHLQYHQNTKRNYSTAPRLKTKSGRTLELTFRGRFLFLVPSFSFPSKKGHPLNW